ncbi:MAG: HD domain-containing protein, partial [Anaerolineales bacterium]|nr:HD domain-containing protein [Anaerolineales bacterium]
RLAMFNDHGPGHALRVKSYATQLGYAEGLSRIELHLLGAGALFHDIGNVVDRGRHHTISQESVERLTREGYLPFTPQEAKLIGLLCLWHRKDYDPDQTDRLRGEVVRTGFLASILRVADAMDIDHRRHDYGSGFWRVLDFFFPEQLHHFTSLDEILGVRIRCDPAVKLQVFTRGRSPDNVQIDMLSSDLGSTPLDWQVEEINVDESPGKRIADATQTSWLIFPFEPHSLVMAALSRKHLEADGYQVGVLCYPDTAQGSEWLWQETLPGLEILQNPLIVVIGDRPETGVFHGMKRLIERWHSQGATVSLQNRHETNWTRIHELLDTGVEVILGGDWAYFWGDQPSTTDLTWAKIASLCTRDPSQSTVGTNLRDLAVSNGLLNTVFSAMRGAAADQVSDWISLGEPILDRITAEDWEYFADQSAAFRTGFIDSQTPFRTEGKVILFDAEPQTLPQAFYWTLEAAIEAQGREPVRGIRYRHPYAAVSWQDGDAVEVLAISHWREEEAVPIRLQIPPDYAGHVHGNESTVRVRLKSEEVKKFIKALVEECNRAV